ncbi:MAG: MerC family mercury resistance protein [Sphingobacteriales bacterium]|nr:MerC family mercury resistance protein [Sphingobacteriales bacterium]MCC7222474.1 MerC family mercury resistance protein [Chitinophagales bacterium]TXI81071.1 MAG: MerC family mercury resistance protein [Crocinitomicaceae bacterium]
MQKASAFLSFFCAIHCLALPILATLMASSAVLPILHHPVIEFLLLAPLALLTAQTAYRQYKRSPRSLYFVALLLGLIGICLALVAHIHALLGISTLYLAAVQWISHRRLAVCCER